MVIDTSVIVAVMLEEEGFEELALKMGEVETREISAVSYMEASMVLITKRGEGVEAILDEMLDEGEIAIVPVSVTQAQIARKAFVTTARGVIALDSTLAIASPTRWPSSVANRCSSRATTSARRM